MAKVILKQLRFIGPAGTPFAEKAATAFHAANSGLIKLPWHPTAGEFSADSQAIVLINTSPTLPADWSGIIVKWDSLDDLPTKLNRLMSKLVSGVDLPDPPPAPPPPAPKRILNAKVGRETAGRKGKGVTTIFELTINESEMAELAQLLKNKCGTGGTVKDGRIEIQGDHRDKIVAELEKLGYKVKRSGG
jgi:translation initiation factor 1